MCLSVCKSAEKPSNVDTKKIGRGDKNHTQIQKRVMQPIPTTVNIGDIT